MDRIAIRTHVPPDEYLAWERTQPSKHEYYDGAVFAMAGGTPRHNALCGSVVTVLTSAHRGRCIVMTSGQRIKAGLSRRYLYPDASIVCGQLEIETNDVLVNPTMVVEVLSNSTEHQDRVTKWESYRRIVSLVDYVLVSQTMPRIEHYQRASDGSWVFREAGPGQRITLSTGVVLLVDEIFDGMMVLPGDEPPIEA